MFKPLVAYALMAGVLSFAFINTASAEPFNADLSKQYMSGDKAAYLAGVHTKKGLDCAACHTSNVISDSETEINKQCVICHGSLEQMGQRQTPKVLILIRAILAKCNVRPATPAMFPA